MTGNRKSGDAGVWAKGALVLAVAVSGCTSSSDDGTNTSLALAGSGSAITMTATLQYALAAGLRCNPDLVIAGAIAAAESSLEPGVQSPTNPPTEGCPTGSVDRGLWQINSCYQSSVSSACAFDPACSATAMVSISHDGTDWTPWATYTGGAYMGHLAAAQAAYVIVCGMDGGQTPVPSGTADGGKSEASPEAGSGEGAVEDGGAWEDASFWDGGFGYDGGDFDFDGGGYDGGADYDGGGEG
jgi:Lysozyme like domain